MLARVLRVSRGSFLIAALAACVLAAPAGAQTKPYSVRVAPPSAVPGGQQTTFTVTFTNLASPQQLGSANLTAPQGFSVVGASVTQGTATRVDNLVQLRDLALQPGKSLTVTVGANVPCPADTDPFTWSVRAKQANDFRGDPGNDFDLSPDSSLTTRVTGAGCAAALRFVGQPQHAVVGTPITTTRYNTPPGGPVTVEVVDGAGNRLTTSTATVTLSLAEGSGPGPLRGTTSVAAVKGVASFGDLNIDTTGSYALVAAIPGLRSVISNAFRVDDAGTACRDNLACTATLTLANARASLAVTASPAGGTGVLTINSAPALNCDGYTELAEGSFAVDFIPDQAGTGRTKVVTATISKDVMSLLPENGAAHLEMCFGAPFTFTVKPGTPPLQQPQPGLFIGLLPDCGSAPCVSKRNKTKAGQGVIEVKAPGGADDPRYGP